MPKRKQPSTTTVRKVPRTGIFDPNYSNDPQYGNVSTLPDGTKRCHVYVRFKPTKNTYYRYQIILPEFEVPTINTKEIDEVLEVDVLIIKNVFFDLPEGNNLEKTPHSAHIIAGLFEIDGLLPDVPKNAEGGLNGETVRIDNKHGEALFIVNKPVAYTVFEGDVVHDVSNIPARGYICLQNYINLFMNVEEMKEDLFVGMNVYIDYDVCKVSYKDAKIWQANFEKEICRKKKYTMLYPNSLLPTDNLVIISKGEVTWEQRGNPADFTPHVNSNKIYKVAGKSLVAAAAGAPNRFFNALHSLAM